MGRSLAAAVLGAVSVLAGCHGGGEGDVDAPGPGPLLSYHLRVPSGLVELRPGAPAPVEWQVNSGPYFLRLDAVDAEDRAVLLDVRGLESGSLQWDGRDPAGRKVPAGHYGVRATALDADQRTVGLVEGEPNDRIVVQGVRFPDAALSFTGAQAMRTIGLTVVTLSSVRLTVALDPDEDWSGDELPVVSAEQAGELVPVHRAFAFTGRTTDGAAIPAGRYRLHAIVIVGGTNGYRVDGPTLDWTP